MSRIVALALASLFVAGCVSRPPPPPATRTTPEGTVELFKAYARQGDPAGEWDILSPNLKARMSQQFGRNVDLADYIQGRNAARQDPALQRAERALQTVFVRSQRPAGPNARHLTVVASEGIFSADAEIRMVQLDRWELRVRGQEPYWGIVGDPNFGADRQADGSFVVWYRPGAGSPRSEQVVPASQVEGYTTAAQWYVDDLGGLESQFMSP